MKMPEQCSPVIQGKLSGYIMFWSSSRFSRGKMQDIESELFQDLKLGIEDI